MTGVPPAPSVTRPMADRVVLVRHGETEWSARRHTGRTDIPLNDEGRRLRRRRCGRCWPAITGIDGAVVLHEPAAAGPATRASWPGSASPGRGRVDDLVEWDYGEAEGKRTDEMRQPIPGWSVWTHPIRGGESLDDVGHRADRVLARLAAVEEHLVVLFAHAHILRILAARWCGLAAGRRGRILTLDPASVSVLGHERERPVIEQLEHAPARTCPPARRRVADLGAR